jgi:hypothetical protein
MEVREDDAEDASFSSTVVQEALAPPLNPASNTSDASGTGSSSWLDELKLVALTYNTGSLSNFAHEAEFFCRFVKLNSWCQHWGHMYPGDKDSGDA